MNTFKKIISWFAMMALLVATGYGIFFMHQHGFEIWFVILISIYTFNSLFALAIFSQRRHSTAKLAWIIVIIILPFFGHAIFLLFGRRYKNRIHYDEYIQSDTFDYEEIEPNENISNDVIDIFNKQSSLSKRGIYNGDIKFFDNGNEAFAKMFDDMRNAKIFLHIHFYIIHPGEIYEEFKSILIQKAIEGIEVKFIVDDFGRWAMPWYEIKELEKYGVNIKIFGKVTFPFIGSQNGYRTHRKMVIIDGKVAHTGGMNIGDEYANLDKKYGNWVDFQTRVTGAIVRSFSLLFIEDWKLVSNEELEISRYIRKTKKGKSQIILIEDGPLIIEEIIQASIINWIYRAKKSIQLTTPYFIPTENILFAIKSAAMAGIDVTIFLPGKADKKSVLIASRYWAQELVEHGVKFREVKDMIIHSKIGIFDGKYAYAGTANIDMRSIYSQFEMVSLFHGPAVKGVQMLFDDYEKMSRPLKEQDLIIGKFWNRLLRIIVSIFAPMM